VFDSSRDGCLAQDLNPDNLDFSACLTTRTQALVQNRLTLATVIATLARI